MTFKTPLSPGCPACVVNEMPPFEPGDAYIAGCVEQERGEVSSFSAQLTSGCGSSSRKLQSSSSESRPISKQSRRKKRGRHD